MLCFAKVLCPTGISDYNFKGEHKALNGLTVKQTLWLIRRLIVVYSGTELEGKLVKGRTKGSLASRTEKSFWWQIQQFESPLFSDGLEGMDTDIFPEQCQSNRKKDKKGFIFSWSMKSWSGILGGNNKPPCQLLFFLVSLIWRSPAFAQGQMSDAAFLSFEAVSLRLHAF